MIKFIRRLRGLDYPDPVVGQVWVSGYNGRRIRVSSVDIQDTGSVFVYIQYDHNSTGELGMGTLYCIGLDRWRRRLRNERREQLSPIIDVHKP